MRNLKDIFENYCDEVCKDEDVMALSLKDGTYYQGYPFVFDATNNLTFIFYGPLAPLEAPEDPIAIKFEDIDLASLCHYSVSDQQWKSDRWDEEKAAWITTDMEAQTEPR